MMRTVGITLLFFLTLSFAAAQTSSNDFNVSMVLAPDDTTPPTTPGPLIATLVTDNGVNLSWGSSTDNFLLSGYQVFRDAAQIATTTLTSFADTGLTASTTYSYFVRAFDWNGNISSSSNVLATTTTFTPPPPPSATSSPNPANPTITTVQLRSFTIEPEIDAVTITWSTNRPTRYEFRWGRTQSYELGFIASQVYQFDHVTFVDGLEPDTIYEYELVVYDRAGNPKVLSRDQFRTLSQPDTTAPSNVADFEAVQRGSDVDLTWQNPPADFAYVRIVRNPLFFPSNPNDGYIVFQGVLEEFTDRGALETWGELYYTAFVYDTAGNRSSGALAYVSRTGQRFDDRPIFPGGSGGSSGPSAAGGSADEPGESESTPPFTFSISDILVIQNNEVIEPVSDTFLVDTTKPFTVHAPYRLFPEHLKTIQVSLYHPVEASDSQSFLLRINNDKTAYEATIFDLGYSGTIPMKMTVYDFSTNQMATAEGSIISKEIRSDVAVVSDVEGPWYRDLWWIPLLLLFVLIWWFLGFLRRSEDKESVRLP